jgi:hypothetical protein
MFAAHIAIKANPMLPAIRRLAIDIHKYGFVTPGMFFESLPAAEFQELKYHTDHVFQNDDGLFSCDKQNEVSIYYTILLTHLLCAGEGHAELIEDYLQVNLNVFKLMWFMKIENLHRKGFGKAIRENYSMFDDTRAIFEPPDEQTYSKG